jgi:hypothetical protein
MSSDPDLNDYYRKMNPMGAWAISYKDTHLGYAWTQGEVLELVLQHHNSREADEVEPS